MVLIVGFGFGLCSDFRCGISFRLRDILCCGFGFSLRLIFLDNSLLLRGSQAAATCSKDKLQQRSIADLLCLWQHIEAGIEFLFAAEP